MGVPPLGYMPSSRLKKSAQFFEEASSIARLHNKLLPIALHKLSKQLKEFKYAFADTHTLLLQRILNPLQYGNKFYFAYLSLFLHWFQCCFGLRCTVIYHIEWRGERSIPYKGVKPLPRFKTLRGNLEGNVQRGLYMLAVGSGCYK